MPVYIEELRRRMPEQVGRPSLPPSLPPYSYEASFYSSLPPSLPSFPPPSLPLLQVLLSITQPYAKMTLAWAAKVRLVGPLPTLPPSFPPSLPPSFPL